MKLVCDTLVLTASRYWIRIK